jgi:hypothetical protein
VRHAAIDLALPWDLGAHPHHSIASCGAGACVLVNGVALPEGGEPRPLVHGDRLTLGPCRMIAVWCEEPLSDDLVDQWTYDAAFAELMHHESLQWTLLSPVRRRLLDRLKEAEILYVEQANSIAIEMSSPVRFHATVILGGGVRQLHKSQVGKLTAKRAALWVEERTRRHPPLPCNACPRVLCNQVTVDELLSDEDGGPGGEVVVICTVPSPGEEDAKRRRAEERRLKVKQPHTRAREEGEAPDGCEGGLWAHRVVCCAMTFILPNLHALFLKKMLALRLCLPFFFPSFKAPKPSASSRHNRESREEPDRLSMMSDTLELMNELSLDDKGGGGATSPLFGRLESTASEDLAGDTTSVVGGGPKGPGSFKRGVNRGQSISMFHNTLANVEEDDDDDLMMDLATPKGGKLNPFFGGDDGGDDDGPHRDGRGGGKGAANRQGSEDRLERYSRQSADAFEVPAFLATNSGDGAQGSSHTLFEMKMDMFEDLVAELKAKIAWPNKRQHAFGVSASVACFLAPSLCVPFALLVRCSRPPTPASLPSASG